MKDILKGFGFTDNEADKVCEVYQHTTLPTLLSEPIPIHRFPKTINNKLESLRSTFHQLHATDQDQITKSKHAYLLAKQHCHNLNHEVFGVIALNTKNIVLGINITNVGKTNATLVDHKRIYRYLILMNAVGFIIFHNHPSNVAKPSANDISLTNKFSEASQLLDLHLIDHIIVCDDEYYSFADNGKIT